MPARANIPLLVAVALITTRGASLADAPLAPDEVRERRLLREERPLWREALALPYDAALVLAWPLKRANNPKPCAKSISLCWWSSCARFCPSTCFLPRMKAPIAATASLACD